MFCICLILHILSWKYFAESFGAFYMLKVSSNTATNFSTSWKFWFIGLNSAKFLNLYLGPFSCKVQVLEKDKACLFLVLDFACFNKSVVEDWLFFTFLSWKEPFFAFEEEICLSEQELVKYHEVANYCVCREPYQ